MIELVFTINEETPGRGVSTIHVGCRSEQNGPKQDTEIAIRDMLVRASNEALAKMNNPPVTMVTDERGVPLPDLLGIDGSSQTDFEVARAVHRVVRGMHDGECPQCHTLFESTTMRPGQRVAMILGELHCLSCGFTISAAEQYAAMAVFGPYMDKNLEIFKAWRKRGPVK